MTTIGVLTSGGDSPGMNACVRAVVRRALAKGYQVKGIQRGFAGLLCEEIEQMTSESVSNVLQHGGTLLETERCAEMKDECYQQKAVDICRKHDISALIIIGGDGSFQGARRLAEKGLNVIGIPGTIDGDIACTEYTIGFDTAVNTAMHAIDNIRDTGASHEKCSIIEVMGRNAGYIALWCGIANGAEEILIPEKPEDKEKVVETIKANRQKGKKSSIIVNAEGVGETTGLAQLIEEKTGVSVRTTVLSFIQRGGIPSCKDRVFASVMGAMAVDLIDQGKQNRIVAYRKGEFVDYDIVEALSMERKMDSLSSYLYEIYEDLSI